MPLHQDQGRRGNQPETDIDHHRKDTSGIIPTYAYVETNKFKVVNGFLG
jgi:hypothetical protein